MNSLVFREPKQHGTSVFPFEYHYINSSHPRYVMPHHWHKEWEIIHVIEGKFTAQTDGVVYTVHSGEFLLVRDGMLHGGIPDGCVYECFLFDLHAMFMNLDMANKHLRPIFRHQILPNTYYPAGCVNELNTVISDLSDAYKDIQNSGTSELPLELIAFASIGNLFSTILRKKLYTTEQTVSSDGSRKIDLIKAVLEYIELHYSTAITLDQLASVANMNASYFCRFFRSITHQSPMDYVNMFRIEKAAQMLRKTNHSVTQICMECGFNECSNFIKVFRKYKGTTPMRYRKSI